MAKSIALHQSLEWIKQLPKLHKFIRNGICSSQKNFNYKKPQNGNKVLPHVVYTTWKDYNSIFDVFLTNRRCGCLLSHAKGHNMVEKALLYLCLLKHDKWRVNRHSNYCGKLPIHYHVDNLSKMFDIVCFLHFQRLHSLLGLRFPDLII